MVAVFLILFPISAVAVDAVVVDATAATAQAAPEVTSVAVERPSYLRAYLAMGAGVVLTVGSFLLAESADRAYDRYREGVDPVAIEDDYRDARRLDRWSAATLLTGQGAIALGLYWRFVRHPSGSERAGALEETGPEWSVGPFVGRGRAGVALACRFP